MLKSKKAEIIAELEATVRGSSSAIVTDYRGLSVAQIYTLRGDLIALGATYHVAKNTLLRIAAEQAGKPELSTLLSGPTAVAFASGDPAPIARRLSDAVRETRILKLRGAYVDGRILDEANVRVLATLPPREVLLAQVVGGIAAPLSGFVNVLAAIPRSLVVALDQIRLQKEQQAA